MKSRSYTLLLTTFGLILLGGLAYTGYVAIGALGRLVASLNSDIAVASVCTKMRLEC